MSRLFFAVWPDDAAREKLAALAAEVVAEAGGRAVPAANVHLTLEFLGEVEEGRIPGLHAAADSVAGRAFELRLDRLGSFRRARVGWAGCARPPDRLLELQRELATALAAAGFALEDRPYAPHVTLARKIERPVRARELAPIAWRAHELALVLSESGKARYTTIASWRLRSR